MSQRGRKNNDYGDSGGGNVLFTLGLVSVVALLVVGYVMTQGGVKSLTENGLSRISLTPTATPRPAPTQVAQASTAVIDEIVRKYEKELQQLKTFYEKQIQELRENYEMQITDLNTRIQLLEVSNKNLRSKNQ
ncbi:MAG: hypothetical protein JXR73_04590 [Candidatus Omnitrophica bacterium]|nr:hypothetical protein [Candidatus Omnitrophota bacterium]